MYVYDIETYPNCFTCAFQHVETGETRVFEISSRKNESQLLYSFFELLKVTGQRLIGFNNVNFDYPVIHLFLKNPNCGYTSLYNKAMQIIFAPDEQKWAHLVRPWEVLIPQVDLYLINHFDNEAKRTSLKALEFAMRSDSIEDLPFDVGIDLTSEQIDVLIKYNLHDVSETVKFYHHCKTAIDFRDDLSKKYAKDFTNFNDGKIGKEYFIMKLEEQLPGSCYEFGTRTKRQTIRSFIDLGSVVLPYVQFEQPEFNRILAFFRQSKITETKGVFEGLIANVNGFDFVFGVGGIHGSVESQVVYSDNEYLVRDADVSSFYPNLAIKNRLYPEHLSESFCDIYEDVYNQRKNYPKGSAENGMLKLALNSVYGDSNNKHSVFYDPAYTMSITINGQLLLCMLAEQLMKIPELQMVQINTDGLTVKLPRKYLDQYQKVCDWWCNLTKLDLEYADYSRFYVRDVNNYLAVYTDGKVKRKGAYEYKIGWHQNHSCLVVPKVAELNILYGLDIETAVRNHRDNFDFMMLQKAKGQSKLYIGDAMVQKHTRYYVSKNGAPMTVVRKPTGIAGQYKRKAGISDSEYNSVMAEIGHDVWDARIHTKNKSKYEDSISAVNKGYLATACNRVEDFNRGNVYYEYYIAEVKKLVERF